MAAYIATSAWRISASVSVASCGYTLMPTLLPIFTSELPGSGRPIEPGFTGRPGRLPTNSVVSVCP